jgi:hypothetical protein
MAMATFDTCHSVQLSFSSPLVALSVDDVMRFENKRRESISTSNPRRFDVYGILGRSY